MSDHATKQFVVPLFDFGWRGKDFDFGEGFKIEYLSELPEFAFNVQGGLSKLDLSHLRFEKRWLSFEVGNMEDYKASEKMNIFLVALWIAVPSRTTARFRFVRDKLTGQIIDGTALHSYMSHIHGHGVRVVNDVDLEQTKVYLKSLLSIPRDSRLWNALLLTLMGGMAVSWQPMFIAYAASLETLLTYSEGPGLTARLAKTYACLINNDEDIRDHLVEQFRRLYSVRSDIVHGRGHRQAGKTDNEANLAEFANMLRAVWDVALREPSAAAALNKPDVDRKTWFTAREAGYVAP